MNEVFLFVDGRIAIGRTSDFIGRRTRIPGSGVEGRPSESTTFRGSAGRAVRAFRRFRPALERKLSITEGLSPPAIPKIQPAFTTQHRMSR